MAVVGFKKNLLNRSAFGNGQALLSLVEELGAEYAKQMPERDSSTRLAALTIQYKEPPPDEIKLPRERFERLMTQLSEMSASLLKYSEPPKRR